MLASCLFLGSSRSLRQWLWLRGLPIAEFTRTGLTELFVVCGLWFVTPHGLRLPAPGGIACAREVLAVAGRGQGHDQDQGQGRRADAVFEGGGVRGIAFVGAVSAFEEAGYGWHFLAGTSAGAIIASLLAAGYDADQLRQLMDETDFRRFAIREGMAKIPLLGPPASLFSHLGLHSGCTRVPEDLGLPALRGPLWAGRYAEVAALEPERCVLAWGAGLWSQRPAVSSDPGSSATKRASRNACGRGGG